MLLTFSGFGGFKRQQFRRRVECAAYDCDVSYVGIFAVYSEVAFTDRIIVVRGTNCYDLANPTDPDAEQGSNDSGRDEQLLERELKSASFRSGRCPIVRCRCLFFAHVMTPM